MQIAAINYSTSHDNPILQVKYSLIIHYLMHPVELIWFIIDKQ